MLFKYHNKLLPSNPATPGIIVITLSRICILATLLPYTALLSVPLLFPLYRPLTKEKQFAAAIRR